MKISKDPFNLWYDIPGYDGKYQASKLGEIRRVYKNGKVKVLSQYTKKSAKSNRRRLYVKLTFNGKNLTFNCLYCILKVRSKSLVLNFSL